MNYRIANCPRIAAPFYVGVECPAVPLYTSAQPKPSIFGWLFITHLSLVVNGELGQFALNHQHFMYVAALLLLFLPCPGTSLRWSVSTCCVLSIACEHSYQHGTFNKEDGAASKLALGRQWPIIGPRCEACEARLRGAIIALINMGSTYRSFG
jgi:hypothetical protein